MANNRVQVKRTSTSGRTPNTTGSYATNSQYISAGELALNMTDGILYTSDGTNLITVGANQVSQRVTGTLTVNAISANGGVGTSGQVLKSNGSSTFWGTDSTDVGAASQILYRNSSNVLTTSSGLQYDGTSIKVNGNLESVYQNGDEGGEIFLNKPVTGTSITSGVTIDVFQNKLRFFENGGANRGAYIDITAAANGVGSNLLAGGGGGSGTVTSVDSGSGLTGGPITSSGTLSVLANTGIVANSTGTFVNATYIGTLSANNTTYVNGKTEGNLNVNNALTSNNSSFLGGNSASDLRTYSDDKAANAYSNAVSYVDGKSYVNTSQLSSNLSNYQTTAGLAANVAVLAANSATYLGNSSGTIANVSSWITTNASAAYTNAIAFASNASNINTGTLAEARLPFRMDQNVSTSNNVTFGSLTLTGNLTVSGNVTVIGANALSIVDNMIYLNSNNTTQNIDVGVVANYNSGAYAHTGIFRDASDGYWKVFDSYLPEPDANVNIDTTNTSFHLADFQANSFYAGNTSTNWFIANTTGAYHTGLVNAASYRVGTSTIANSTGVYTGVVNGSSITVGTAFTANATVVNAVSYYAGSTLIGNTTGPYGKTESNLNVNSALTSNNSSFLGGTAAASYQLNSTLNANIASYLPTYTGVVNGASHTVGSSFIANATGVYHTGTMNAASHTVGTSTVANATGVYTGIVNATTISTGSVNVINASGLTTTSNVSIGAAGELIIAAGAGISANGGFGTSGQVLTSNASSIYWSTIAAGATLNANNTETGTFYFGMANTTSGTWSNAVVSTTKISFVPNTGALTVNGSISATTKSFLIDHPTKSGMKLRYASLEGPENGVYVRGKLNGYVIELPDYWTGLVDEDTITVQLTAIGEPQSLYVVEVSDNQVFINSNEGVPYCYYTVYGERKDVDKLVVEY